jgi:hypothetical protein
MLTTSSFLEHLDRLFAPGYVPTNQDIVRAQKRLTGIYETIFDSGALTYRIVDVGAQRLERKKWKNTFDNVQVVLFTVAISCYDQTLVEDRSGVG